MSDTTKATRARSFILVKPPKDPADLSARIIVIRQMILARGLSVVDEIGPFLATYDQAAKLYGCYDGKDYYPWLIEQQTSGQVYLFVIEGDEDVVEKLKKLVGPTKPEDAVLLEDDNIRKHSPDTFRASREQLRAVDNMCHTPDEDRVEFEASVFDLILTVPGD